jgi:hypothetical protein
MELLQKLLNKETDMHVYSARNTHTGNYSGLSLGMSPS